ncbi:MAG: AAA family ATPase, partial [Armatimonadota bacterium]
MEESTVDVSVVADRIAAVRSEVAKAVVGQREVIDQVLIALLCEGHVLLEGVPGIAKTL